MDDALIQTLIYKQCPKLAHRFTGCFPCNTFPQLEHPGQFQIVNTDPADAVGRHWVLIGRYSTALFNQSMFYFDSLDVGAQNTKVLLPTHKDIRYDCIRNRLLDMYSGHGGITILRPAAFGIVPQNQSTSTCALYCIFMAHVVYTHVRVGGVTEDDILQFAQEHFQRRFNKKLLYL